MKKIWKILLVIAVALLFVGTIILIGLGNIDKIGILQKTP